MLVAGAFEEGEIRMRRKARPSKLFKTRIESRCMNFKLGGMIPGLRILCLLWRRSFATTEVTFSAVRSRETRTRSYTSRSSNDMLHGTVPWQTKPKYTPRLTPIPHLRPAIARFARALTACRALIGQFSKEPKTSKNIFEGLLPPAQSVPIFDQKKSIEFRRITCFLTRVVGVCYDSVSGCVK